MKTCYLCDTCPYYDSGDSKPTNHHVRITIPCVKYLDMSCQIDTDVRLFYGETIACDINKMRGLKGE